MTELFLFALQLMRTAAAMQPLPGSPVDMQPLGHGVMVLCTQRASLVRWDGDRCAETILLPLNDPFALCITGGVPVVTFPEENIIMTGEELIPVPGGPMGISPVTWYPGGDEQLAVCLFHAGRVVLMDTDGNRELIAILPGAKDVLSCDADLDGDRDLFVSCCGSGVFLIENTSEGPVTHRVGSIGEGVKRVAAEDLNGDGLPDPVGIACSEGGIGWWSKHGEDHTEWDFHSLDPHLQGPKCVVSHGGTVFAGSLYSPLFTSGNQMISMLPAGVTSLCINRDGVLFAGLQEGYLTEVNINSYYSGMVLPPNNFDN